MIKYIFTALIGILSILNAQGQFVVKDILAVTPQASIFDPEYNTKFNIVCWKSDDNELWISGLNPVTHLYQPADGKGTYVTGNLSPNEGESWNGPEWMLSSQGTQLVYNKTIGGIRYPGVATQVLGGWEPHTLFLYPNAVYSMATSNYSDSVALFLFETSTTRGIYWVKNTDLNTRYFYPDVTLGFFAKGNQQICCATDKSRHPGFIESASSLPFITFISQDTIGAPFMWNDPETSHRLFVYRTNNNTTIKIFQEINTGLWVLYNSFNSPLPGPFQYLTSPEPFVCGGHSYISFMAAQSGVGKDGLPAQIWIEGANPADSFMRRVSDSSEAIRNDPEPVVFADSAFIYYTHVILDQKSSSIQYSVRKCDTGLANLYTSDQTQKPDSPGISVFPNPGNGHFSLKSPSASCRGALIRVFDMNGKLVLKEISKSDSPDLNLEQLQNGSYTLKIQNHNQVASTELIIMK